MIDAMSTWRHRLRVRGIRLWRRAPFPGGRGRYAVKRWLEPPADDGRRPVPTEVGWLHLEHGADQVQRRLYMSGRSDERGVVARVRALAASRDLEGATALDVGGHCGFYTMLLASIVGASSGASSASRDASGSVIAFEPQPDLAAAIEASAAANGFDRVRVVRAAAADRDGRLTFHRTRDAGHASLSDVGGEDAEALEVESVDLAAWVARELEAPPSLIKLDVEGAEWLVLGDWLAAHRPHLVVEIHPRQIDALGGTTARLLERLRGLGYRLRRIDASGRLESIDEPAAEALVRGPWHLDADPEGSR